MRCEVECLRENREYACTTLSQCHERIVPSWRRGVVGRLDQRRATDGLCACKSKSLAICTIVTQGAGALTLNAAYRCPVHRMRSFNNLNLSSFGNKRKLTDYFERRYLFQRYKINGGNHFIAISEDIETFLKDVIPKEIHNIHLLQNAINTKRFEFRSPFRD